MMTPYFKLPKSLRILTTPLLCLGLLISALPSATFAQQPTKAEKPAKPMKIELGTSAAFDAQGQLWQVSKETDQADTTGKAQYVVLRSSADLGQTWSAPKRVQSTPEAISADGENRPKLAFGNDGAMFIAYTKPLTKPYSGEIRFLRSTDGGKSFSAPLTVHQNRDEITHRFESMIVDAKGRIFIAWIDKRDLEAAKLRKESYRGAAIYVAMSEDNGVSFQPEWKLADHTCECCRIALSVNASGAPVAMWRHIFEPNIRDHAIATLSPTNQANLIQRVSFDDWRVDACPHHGPSLAFGADGARYQTWFNLKAGEGGIFYAKTDAVGNLSAPFSLGSAQASHAEVLVKGSNVAIVWKEFDGKRTKIAGRFSSDAGKTWLDKKLATTASHSDQPHLIAHQENLYLAWQTLAEGMRIMAVDAATFSDEAVKK
jgi:hypothetical protein